MIVKKNKKNHKLKSQNTKQDSYKHLVLDSKVKCNICGAEIKKTYRASHLLGVHGTNNVNLSKYFTPIKTKRPYYFYSSPKDENCWDKMGSIGSIPIFKKR